MLKRRHDAGDVTMADPGSYQNGDPPRHPWENVEDIVQILKTTSPLLIMSMETVIDQINHRFKPTPEEDVYRHIWMLLTDACQVFPKYQAIKDTSSYFIQTTQMRMVAPDDDGTVHEAMTTTLMRVANNLSGSTRVFCFSPYD